METTTFDFQADRWLIDPGPFVPHVLAYGHSLSRLGYHPESIAPRIASARHFCAWLLQERFDLPDADDCLVHRFAEHECRCAGNRAAGQLSRAYIFRVRQFVRYLATTRVLRCPAASAGGEDQRVEEYLDWLRRHRGLSDLTVHSHRKMLRQLLPALGVDPVSYDAALIRSVILERQGKESPGALKRATYVLRSWLRYLGARAECPTALVCAVPTIAHWRGSAFPRYLPEADVERLIAACDDGRPAGRRDRAILLLLARLGLRAEDVRSLKFADIDWHRGHLRLCGKSRRETRLPLPQEVGDAILAYLEHARPAVPEHHVFLRSAAPWRPFRESASISGIVARALDRAGITDTPSRGAHLLRHSAATSMLKRGATIEAIGAFLRHRSITTTAHYAKVDTDTLCLIAQPWPGERSC